jgi:hypothetical protein
MQVHYEGWALDLDSRLFWAKCHSLRSYDPLSPPKNKKVTVAQLVKCSPVGVKVLGLILALMRFLPESKSSPSSILTNLGPLST